MVWSRVCAYPQGPVPVSSCLLHTGASDVPQTTAEKMGSQAGTGGGGDGMCRGCLLSTRQVTRPPAPIIQPVIWGAGLGVFPSLTTHMFRSQRTASKRKSGQKSKGTLPGSSPAQRDSKVEDRQHECACVLGEEVADDGGCDGGVAGLTNAHQPPRQDQQPEVL